MDFDGKGRKTVHDKGISYPFGIALFQEKLYWTDWKSWLVLLKHLLISKTYSKLKVCLFH